jgi:hypothetical protein
MNAAMKIILFGFQQVLDTKRHDTRRVGGSITTGFTAKPEKIYQNATQYQGGTYQSSPNVVPMRISFSLLSP